MRGHVPAVIALLVSSCSGTSHSDARAELPEVSFEVFAAGLERPEGLAFDSAGNLFVTLELGEGAGEIVRFDADGARFTVASGLDGPDGIAFDDAGSLFVTEEHRDGSVLRIGPSGDATVFVAGLDGPEGLVFESSGDLLVTEDFGGRVLRAAASGERTTLASLRKPEGIAIDSAGRILVAESDADRIVALGANGEVAPLAAAAMRQPDGLAWDAPCACILVGEDLESEARLLRVGPGGATVAILGGLEEAQGIAVGPDRAVYVAESRKGRILRVHGALSGATQLDSPS